MKSLRPIHSALGARVQRKGKVQPLGHILNISRLNSSNKHPEVQDPVVLIQAKLPLKSMRVLTGKSLQYQVLDTYP